MSVVVWDTALKMPNEMIEMSFMPIKGLMIWLKTYYQYSIGELPAGTFHHRGLVELDKDTGGEDGDYHTWGTGVTSSAL